MVNLSPRNCHVGPPSIYKVGAAEPWPPVHVESFHVDGGEDITLIADLPAYAYVAWTVTAHAVATRQSFNFELVMPSAYTVVPLPFPHVVNFPFVGGSGITSIVGDGVLGALFEGRQIVTVNVNGEGETASGTPPRYPHTHPWSVTVTGWWDNRAALPTSRRDAYTGIGALTWRLVFFANSEGPGAPRPTPDFSVSADCIITLPVPRCNPRGAPCAHR